MPATSAIVSASAASPRVRQTIYFMNRSTGKRALTFGRHFQPRCEWAPEWLGGVDDHLGRHDVVDLDGSSVLPLEFLMISTS